MAEKARHNPDSTESGGKKRTVNGGETRAGKKPASTTAAQSGKNHTKKPVSRTKRGTKPPASSKRRSVWSRTLCVLNPVCGPESGRFLYAILRFGSFLILIPVRLCKALAGVSKVILSPLILIVPVLIAVPGVLFLLGSPFSGFNIPEFHTQKTVSHQVAVLTEIRDVFLFHTVEYVYRAVFPHDFMPEGITLKGITNRLMTETGRFEDILSVEEREFLRAYDISTHLGLASRSGSGEFVVVSVIVRAGFCLEDSVLSIPGAASPSELHAVFRIEQGPEKTAHIRIPPARVTEVIVEDIEPSTYRFPDVSISPRGWQEISAFVSERVTQRTIENGILKTAEENGQEFAKSLLLAAGYDRVEFMER
jgi:hypothetical protein